VFENLNIENLIEIENYELKIIIIKSAFTISFIYYFLSFK